MAEWPEVEELKRIVALSDSEAGAEIDAFLDRALASGIRRVQLDVGNWDEYEDEPDEMLAQAALRMAELLAQRPDADATALAADPTYRRLLFGHRRVFGVA